MPTIEELTDDLSNLEGQLSNANRQIQTLDGVITNLQLEVQVLQDERAAVKKAFAAHKTETQRRLDELSKIENFSWEKYHQILVEHKGLSEKASALEKKLSELHDSNAILQNNLKLASDSKQVDEKYIQSLQAIISSHEVTIKSLRDELNNLKTELAG